MFPLSNSKPLTSLTLTSPENSSSNPNSDLEPDLSSDGNSEHSDDVHNSNNRQTVPPPPPLPLPLLPLPSPLPSLTSTPSPSSLPTTILISAQAPLQSLTSTLNYAIRSHTLTQPSSSQLSNLAIASTSLHYTYGFKTFDYIVHLEKKSDFYRTHCKMLEKENQYLKRKINQQDNA